MLYKKYTLYGLIFLLAIIFGFAYVFTSKHALAADTQPGEYVYIIQGGESTDNYTYYYDLMRSTNYGASFKKIADISIPGLDKIDNIYPQNLAASYNGRFVYAHDLKSSDFGESFTKMSYPVFVKNIVTDSSGKYVYISDGSSVYRSANYAEAGSFERVASLPNDCRIGTAAGRLAVSGNGKYVYGACESSYMIRSDNYGVSGSFKNTSFIKADKFARSFGVSEDGRYVYVYLEKYFDNPSYIYVSNNYGADNSYSLVKTFTSSMYNLYRGLILSVGKNGEVYMLGSNFRNAVLLDFSLSLGSSWSRKSIQVNMSSIPAKYHNTLAQAGSYVFVATTEDIVNPSLYSSSDKGYNFSRLLLAIGSKMQHSLVTTMGGTVTDPPTILSFTASPCGDTSTTGDHIKLSWQTQNAETVNVYKKNNSNGNWDSLETYSGNSGSYTDTSVVIGTTYQYKIGVQGVGFIWSSTQSATAQYCGQAPTVDLKVDGNDGTITIAYGGTATLTWDSTDTTSCSAAGSWSGTKATDNASGEAMTNLTTTQYYTIYCDGPGGTVGDSVVVKVSEPSTPTVDLKLDGLDNPAPYAYNATALLTWESVNATSCTASGSWTGNRAIKETTGESTGNLTSPSTYTLTCDGPGGSANDSVSIKVLPSDFTMSGDSNCVGESPQIILNWSQSELADSFSIYRDNALVDSDITTQSWTDVGLISGTTYNYLVQAINDAGLTIGLPNPLSLSALNCALVPRLFKGLWIGNSITFTPSGSLELIYDARVAKLPPPGFVDLFAPIWTETGP